MLDRFDLLQERIASVRASGASWPLEGWASPDDPGLMRLVFYIRDCTAPTDRIFVSQYFPQVLALAQRPFAAGHGDLRPGFFGTTADQQLAVARLAQQRVPLAVLPAADDLAWFKEHFPIVEDYLWTHLKSVGEYELGNDIRIHLLASRDIEPQGTWRETDWPCYR